MKKCQKCGYSNEDNAKFCKNCGREFVDISENQLCKHCGKPIIPGTRFCKHCGSLVEARKEPVPEVKKDEKIQPKNIGSQNNSTILAIAAIVILIAVIIVICQKLSKDDYNSNNQNYVDNNNYDDVYENIYEGENQDISKFEDTYENSINEQESYESEDYILEGSNYRYLTKADLAGLTAEQCRLARNEIYARHGRMFKDEALQEYFETFDWYNPTIQPDDFEESMLNEYEIANRDLIVEYELKQGYR